MTLPTLLLSLSLSLYIASGEVLCQRPSTWCTHGGSTFKYKRCGDILIPTCIDNINRVGQILRKNGKCVSNWPYGEDTCEQEVLPLECARPGIWCTHGGSTFKYIVCDGKRVPQCTDTVGRIGQIRKIDGVCTSTWPNGYRGCDDLVCARPPIWCTHGGSTFKYIDCGDDRIAQCTDTAGRVGQLIRGGNGKCVSTWPTGQRGCGSAAKSETDSLLSEEYDNDNKGNYFKKVGLNKPFGLIEMSGVPFIIILVSILVIGCLLGAICMMIFVKSSPKSKKPQYSHIAMTAASVTE